MQTHFRAHLCARVCCAGTCSDLPEQKGEVVYPSIVNKSIFSPSIVTWVGWCLIFEEKGKGKVEERTGVCLCRPLCAHAASCPYFDLHRKVFSFLGWPWRCRFEQGRSRCVAATSLGARRAWGVLPTPGHAHSSHPLPPFQTSHYQ